MKSFDMPHSNHNKHLCYLVNIGVQQRDPDGFKKLVNKPKYMCKQCGRVSNKARNLCRPDKLE